MPARLAVSGLTWLQRVVHTCGTRLTLELAIQPDALDDSSRLGLFTFVLDTD